MGGRSAGFARSQEASNNLFLSRNLEKGEKFTIIFYTSGLMVGVYGGDFRRIQKIFCPDLYSFSVITCRRSVFDKVCDNRTSTCDKYLLFFLHLFFSISPLPCTSPSVLALTR